MRKAGGTTLRMNVAAGCRPRGVQVVEQEWGAFKWNAAATRAKRGAEETLALITSVVPPMERLVSAYFFEGPRHGGSHTHGSPCHASQHDPGINLEGAVPSPSWTAQNWAFVRSCFGSYLQLQPFGKFVTSVQNQTFVGADITSNRYFGPNYYLHKLLTHLPGDEPRLPPCTPLAHGARGCHVSQALWLLRNRVDLVVLFRGGAPTRLLRRRAPSRLIPCCLETVQWHALTSYTALGTIHRPGWLDQQVAALTHVLRTTAPEIYREAWQYAVKLNALDQHLYDSLEKQFNEQSDLERA